MDHSKANGRIVNNTGLLFTRLIFLTFVNLFAVRITLEALGETDFGLYNVIASVVTALTILSGAMTSATQRFLAFHLGREDYPKYNHTFTLLLMSFITIAIIMIAVGEILGYFFVEKWLTIPPDRRTASYWVFQTSLLAFAIGFITIPYTSSIIANEKMQAFALFSIVEGILKVAIAYTIMNFNGDRLILYGVLTAGISVTILLMSMAYCHLKFKYWHYVWKWDRAIFSQLSKYTGWNLLGSASGLFTSQGQNILLNIYFGPIINTAKAIADRIYHVINGFSMNLYMAVSPQIVKSYAVEDYVRAMKLVLKTSKITFLLIFILAFPLICNIDGILQLWLGADAHTPDMSVFSQLLLIYSLVLSLEPPITRIIQATGNLRNYELWVSFITLSYIPITALALYLGGNAVLVIEVLILIMGIAQIIRVVIAHRQVDLDYSQYAKEVLFPIAKVVAVGVAGYLMLDRNGADSDIIHTLVNTCIATLFGLFIAVFIGLDKSDRHMLIQFIRNKIR